MRLAPLAHSSLEALADLFYPPHCPVCERPAARPHTLCEACEKDIPRLAGPRCQICSHPFDGVGASAFFTCPNCRGHGFHFECATSVMRAAGPVRELIHAFKYGRQQHLRCLLGNWLTEALDDERIAPFRHDLLIPVPLHPARARERHFDQALLLAEHVSRRSGIPWRPLLQRTRYTITQTQFDRRRRMRNLRGAFKLRKNASVTQLRILLVDDVLTTGATLDACAHILLSAGAQSVRAITVARG
jgi:ComF family protein